MVKLIRSRQILLPCPSYTLQLNRHLIPVPHYPFSISRILPRMIVPLGSPIPTLPIALLLPSISRRIPNRTDLASAYGERQVPPCDNLKHAQATNELQKAYERVLQRIRVCSMMEGERPSKSADSFGSAMTNIYARWFTPQDLPK
jgi:hypothetical protein